MRSNRQVPFRFTKRVSDLSNAFDADVASALREAQSSVIPSDNFYGYTHGKQWRHQPGTNEDTTGEFHSQEIELEIPFSRIVDNDVSAISDLRADIVTKMMAGFMRMMYQTISLATEQTGNIVSAGGTQFRAEHFIEMLERIEFGVDRQGNVTLPEIHAGPAAAKKILAELSAQGPEFQHQVEAITAKKTREALASEAQRKSRFPKRT